MKRSAFTMLELIMAIIVLGILATLAIPRIDRDRTQEGADSILSDIRYTQLLALTDNKHRFNDPSWQRAFWRIGFGNCAGGSGIYEYIGSDDNLLGAIDNNESATDPANGKRMNWGGGNCAGGGDAQTSERIFLTKKYGVTAFALTGSCSNAQYIGFDYMGRLHQGNAASGTPNYASYLNAVCTITFTMDGGSTFGITVQPETGYTQIVGQPDS